MPPLKNSKGQSVIDMVWIPKKVMGLNPDYLLQSLLRYLLRFIVDWISIQQWGDGFSGQPAVSWQGVGSSQQRAYDSSSYQVAPSICWLNVRALNIIFYN